MIEFEICRSGYDYYHTIHVKNLNFRKHTHRSYEFVFVKSGILEVYIENSTYILRSENGVLIAPYEIHSFSTFQSNHVLSCIFSPEIVDDFYNFSKNKRFLNPVFTFSTYNPDLLDEKLNNYFEKKSILYAICSNVLKNGIEHRSELKNYELLSKISSYINENIFNDISLKTLCKELGYSYNYISGIFKNEFGTNFSSYVNQIKLEHAARLLIHTDLTSSQVSDQCNYKTIRNFNTAFKNYYNMTPKEYRLKYKR